MEIAPDWYPDWRGEIVAVVAGGASAAVAPLDTLRGRCRVILVNNGYQLAGWADVLYAADGAWWGVHPAARAFAGMKVTAHRGAAASHRLRFVEVLDGDKPGGHILSMTPGVLGHGGHSGFQAINLAVQFGGRRLLLIGFDFCGDHWHPQHEPPLRNAAPRRLERWRERLDEMAQAFAGLGVEMLNCSPGSALTAYRRASIEEALAG